MELRQLRYFGAVFKERNLTRAAQALGMGSSALSEQIMALEREMGVPLFRRTPSGMVPTAAGQALAPHAHAVVSAAGVARRAVEQSAGAARRWRVGVTPGSPHELVARVWDALRGAGIAAEPVDASTAEQLDAVRVGSLEVGLVCLPIDARGMRTALVSDVPLGVLMADGHPLAERSEVAWPDLADQELLWFPRELAPGYHDDVLAVCRAAGWWPTLRARPPRRALFTAELLAARRLVALRPVTSQADGPGLVWRPLGSAPRLRHALVWAGPGTDTASVGSGAPAVTEIMADVAAALSIR
ncbi:LysR family transcriptional regulator [Streptomyces sp. NPDC058486]|uniref:LysR family transcriptional regulator n=1 Tax=unclassified Streptomyces TaxID=2593676 RepID=UPI0036512CA6